MKIYASQWDEVGDEADPRARLLTHFEINGCPMHLEAVAVRPVNMAPPFDGQTFEDQIPQWIQTALLDSTDGAAAQTVEIQGRRYVLIATPYQQ